MLTRHFYELETVCYALLDSLRHKRTTEAVFWARELVLSYEDETLTKTMIQAWIMFMGSQRIDWLDAWFSIACDAGGCDAGGCQRLVLVAEFSERTIGIGQRLSCVLTFWIASRGFSPVASEERVAQALGENDPICLYWWLGTSYDKKPSSLLSLVSSYVDSPELFDSLNKAVCLKLSVHLRTLLSVCAVQLLCLESYPEPLQITRGPLVAELLSTWSTGKRQSRLFSIKPEMLPQGYKRILQADALCESAVKVMAQGCKFWQNIGALINDDSSLESVVDTYFPDDIPDEWSVADRAKSHPVALDVYKVFMKPGYRIKLVWKLKHIPLFRLAMLPQIKLLFKACSVPDRG